ncbi:MAG: MFS transporter [Candidatus Gracilibacteria bacterium]|jgi:MFS family permease
MNQNTKSGILKGTGRNIFLLGLVSLFTDLSSQMIFPLIPLYLTSVLGASAYVVGIVEGAAETTASLLKVVSGYWSDKIKKRKPFVLLGYGLSALAKPLFAIANSWSFVLGVRVTDRVGKGLRDAPRDALVAESCGKDVLGKAYGYQRSMDGFGSVLGAVAAFILLPILGYKNIFSLAIIPGIFAVLTVLFIKEKIANKDYVKKEPLKINFGALSFNLKLFVIVTAIFSLGHFGYAFLLLKSKDMGFTDHTTIFLYAFFYLIYTIITIPAGIISDKIGRKPILLLGYILFAVTCVGLIFANSFYSLLFFFAVYGIFFALIDGTQRAFIVDLSPKELKATALGTLQTAIGIVALPGGFIAGLLWDKFGSTATFVYGAVLSIIALILFLFIKNPKKSLKLL